MKKDIVIIGDGHLAKMLCSFPNVVGYVKPESYDYIFDLDDKKIRKLNPQKDMAVVGIADPKFKKESTEKWLKMGYKLGRLIHPKSTIFGKPKISMGVILLPYSYVDHGSEIGVSTYVGSHTAIHKAIIKDYAHLTFGCQIIMATIGEGAILGSNATVLDSRVVGEYSIVGAGSTVHKDVPPYHKLIQVVNEKLTPIKSHVWTEAHFRSKKV